MTAQAAEQTTTTTTTAPKRASRATKSAARNTKPASTTKPAARKSTAAKSTTKKTPATPKGPSDRDMRQVVSQMILDMAGDLVKSWRPADHDGISRETALDAARQTMGYVSHSLTWPSALGARYDANGRATVGRPAPAKKSE